VAVLQDLPLRLEGVGDRSPDVSDCHPFAPSRFAAIERMKHLKVTWAAPKQIWTSAFDIEVPMGDVFGRSKMHGTWSD
jgi:hypothetical protein